MHRAQAILHPTHNLALGQDQDNGTGQDKAEDGEKGHKKLQELP